MKETTLALMLTISALLLCAVFAESASANFKPYKPPQASILSPSANGKYYSSSIPLTVNVQIFSYTPVSIEHLDSLNYSLDGQEHVPISFAYPSSYAPGYYLHGNGTLTGLSEGIHNLIVLGETTYGPEKKHFNITTSFTVYSSTTVLPESLPTALIIAAAVTAAIIGAGLLVYFKKRKHEAELS